MSSFRFRVSALLLLLLALVFTVAQAADTVFTTPEGAIRGYDPVAYHVQETPVRGDPAIFHDWKDARWYFASEENRARFVADPARYAPAYGGFCAYGTSQGYKVGTDPAAFAIVDGRLYLNYSRGVQRTWNQDRPGYIAAADRHWPLIMATPYRPE
jgi:hypothetical protein